MPGRPVWAEISLDHLRNNYALLRRRAGAAAPHGESAPELLAVVKADAYGHGVELCGPALAAAGASWLGVTSVVEGATLRRALGVLPGHLATTRILIMSSLWESEAETLLDRGLTPLVWEPYQVALLVEAALRRGLGEASVPVHIEIDSGMARQGVRPGSPLAELIRVIAASPPIRIEGVMTHFSAPEELASPQTDLQLERFREALAQLRAAGICPAWVHAGNSATIFDRQHMAALGTLAADHGARLMVRPGLALYGYPVRFTSGLELLPELEPSQEQQPSTGQRPSAELISPEQRSSPQLRPSPEETGPAQEQQPSPEQRPTPQQRPSPGQAGLTPVLAWKTRITSLRDLAPGDGAGYNSTFRATRPTRLALTPVGYADGLNRLLSNPTPCTSSAMLVRGQRAPIAGRISMDQTILDVTDIPSVAIGDEVVILGEQETSPPEHRTASIIAWEHADLCGTIPYEILCNIAARVPRGVVDS